MDSYRLNRRSAVAFAMLMAVAVVTLVYAAWLIRADAGSPGVGAVASPSMPPPRGVVIRPCTPAQPEVSPTQQEVFHAHRFEIGAGDVRGLAYLPRDRTLLLARVDTDGTRLESFTLFGDAAGVRALSLEQPRGLTTNAQSKAPLIVLDASGTRLDLVSLPRDGPDADPVNAVDLRAAGVGRVTGLDVDPSTSSVILADTDRDRLLRVKFRELPRGMEPIGEVIAACEIPLAVLREADEVVVGVEPNTGELYVGGAGATMLYELTPEGVLVATYDLASAGVAAIRGLAFAPSADPTDDEGIQHLYVLDQGSSRAHVSAISFEPPPNQPSDAVTIDASIVATADVSRARPPSSDPGGAAYDPDSERVIVTDSDIDEISEFADHSVFALGEGGAWSGLGTVADLHEVTDVAIDADGGRWFFADDGAKVVIVFDLGDDRAFGTRDDRVRRISTLDFGSNDPEGLTFGQGSLFISDGVSAEVFRLTPGEDGVFEGIGARSDDSVTSFDTAALGVSDPEGIDFDERRGTLYVIGRDQQEPIIEVGTNGDLIARILVGGEVLVAPGGLALLPQRDDGVVRLMITDRGQDNASSTTPNDGKLYEIEFAPASPPPG